MQFCERGIPSFENEKKNGKEIQITASAFSTTTLVLSFCQETLQTNYVWFRIIAIWSWNAIPLSTVWKMLPALWYSIWIGKERNWSQCNALSLTKFVSDRDNLESFEVCGSLWCSTFHCQRNRHKAKGNFTLMVSYGHWKNIAVRLS